MPPLLKYEDYTIAWICAVKAKLLAAMVMLDERHKGVFPSRNGDENQYIPGTIAGHNVIIVALPRRTTGTVSAATLVTNLKANFRNIRHGLLVGIGAGVPGRNLKPDIRLGDVIVAGPGDDSNSSQGVLQYDLGKESVNDFVSMGWVQPTDRRLRTAIETIDTEADFKGHVFLAAHLARFQRSPKGTRFLYPRTCNDNLYESEAIGSAGAERYELISRPVREFEGPAIHYGLVASGDKVIKNPKVKRRFAR